MTQPLNLIVFDFDGTLVDTNAIKREAFFQIFPHDKRFTACLGKILEKDYTATRQEILTWAYADYGAESHSLGLTLDEAIDRYGELTSRLVVEAPEIEGAEHLFTSLTAMGYSLALNSGTPQDTLRDITYRRHWSHWFTAILGAPVSKKQNILKLSGDTGIPLSSILMVGDRETDQVGAKEAGCHFVGLIRPDNDFKSKPLHMIASLLDLVPLLQSKWSPPISLDAKCLE